MLKYCPTCKHLLPCTTHCPACQHPLPQLGSDETESQWDRFLKTLGKCLVEKSWGKNFEPSDFIQFLLLKGVISHSDWQRVTNAKTRPESQNIFIDVLGLKDPNQAGECLYIASKQQRTTQFTQVIEQHWRVPNARKQAENPPPATPATTRSSTSSSSAKTTKPVPAEKSTEKTKQSSPMKQLSPVSNNAVQESRNGQTNTTSTSEGLEKMSSIDFLALHLKGLYQANYKMRQEKMKTLFNIEPNHWLFDMKLACSQGMAESVGPLQYETLFDAKRRIVLLTGEPGSGKRTFTTKLAYDWSEDVPFLKSLFQLVIVVSSKDSTKVKSTTQHLFTGLSQSLHNTFREEATKSRELCGKILYIFPRYSKSQHQLLIGIQKTFPDAFFLVLQAQHEALAFTVEPKAVVCLGFLDREIEERTKRSGQPLQPSSPTSFYRGSDPGADIRKKPFAHTLCQSMGLNMKLETSIQYLVPTFLVSLCNRLEIWFKDNREKRECIKNMHNFCESFAYLRSLTNVPETEISFEEEWKRQAAQHQLESFPEMLEFLSEDVCLIWPKQGMEYHESWMDFEFPFFQLEHYFLSKHLGSIEEEVTPGKDIAAFNNVEPDEARLQRQKLSVISDDSGIAREFDDAESVSSNCISEPPSKPTQVDLDSPHTAFSDAAISDHESSHVRPVELLRKQDNVTHEEEYPSPSPSPPPPPLSSPALPPPQRIIGGGESTADTGLTAVALYDYQAGDTDEISFDPDDIITNIEMMDAGWWRGSCNGKYGLFPANYAELRCDLPPPPPLRPQDTIGCWESTADTGLTAVALYDYQALDTDEISFDLDDVITNIQKVDAGWWRGSCNGKHGLFPANYVELRGVLPPPPPPRPQDIVGGGESTADTGLTAEALYEYQAGDTNEISFDPDDIITNIQKVDAGWWRGSCNGQYGLFPANYIIELGSGPPSHPPPQDIVGGRESTAGADVDASEWVVVEG